LLTVAGKITALRTQKRNSKRVSVFLDGEYAFGLAAEEAVRLQIGQLLSDVEIERLLEADRLQTAYQRALHLLSYRPRSVQEVRRNLTGKGFSENAVEAALRRLEQAGLLNDIEFARFWVEQRHDFRPRSTAMLRHELRQKGVPPDVISHALRNLDEDELAYQTATRFAGRLSSLPRDEFRRKLSGYLARRGFPYAVIEAAVSRLTSDLEMERED
jgi:regulatory protein